MMIVWNCDATHDLLVERSPNTHYFVDTSGGSPGAVDARTMPQLQNCKKYRLKKISFI
jgi:hypothetical protein